MTVAEEIAPVEDVADDADRDDRRDHVPPHEPVAKALRRRKQEKDERQRKCDVYRAQLIGRHDFDSGVEMKERHHHRERGDEECEATGVAVVNALFFFDELLDPLARFLAQRHFALRRIGSFFR